MPPNRLVVAGGQQLSSDCVRLLEGHSPSLSSAMGRRQPAPKSGSRLGNNRTWFRTRRADSTDKPWAIRQWQLISRPVHFCGERFHEPGTKTSKSTLRRALVIVHSLIHCRNE